MLINLTPHDITIIDGEDKRLIPKSGTIARLNVTRVTVAPTDGIYTASPMLGETVGLPAREAGVFFLVSALVAEANKDRNDLRSPGELVRDSKGNPVGCLGLCQYA